MVIKQGDIFWVELEEPRGSEPGNRHPHVIIQNNLFNQSRIRTVMVCPLTSNLKRVSAPSNVLLEKRGKSAQTKRGHCFAGIHGGQKPTGRADWNPLCQEDS